MEAMQLSPCSLRFPWTLQEMGSGTDLGYSQLWSGIMGVPTCVRVCVYGSWYLHEFPVTAVTNDSFSGLRQEFILL